MIPTITAIIKSAEITSSRYGHVDLSCYYHNMNINETSAGFLLVDKPAGITSHDVIDRLRRITGIRKIGHAGTLDPFATGLLIIAVQRQATKHIQQFVGMDKTYEAEFILGATTESLDPETPIQEDEGVHHFSRADVEGALPLLTGEIAQIPPMHSAIKVGGKKLYELARKGEEIERKPRMVTIHDFRLLNEVEHKKNQTHIFVHISCSSGTYVRALARDLGVELKTTGFVQTLRRTSIASFHVQDTVQLDNITAKNWLTFLKTPEDMGIDVQ